MDIIDFVEILQASEPFRVFTETDWDAFSGCESKSPLISSAICGPVDQETHTVIIDGSNIQVFDKDVNLIGALVIRNLDVISTNDFEPIKE